MKHLPLLLLCLTAACASTDPSESRASNLVGDENCRWVTKGEVSPDPNWPTSDTYVAQGAGCALVPDGMTACDTDPVQTLPIVTGETVALVQLHGGSASCWIVPALTTDICWSGDDAGLITIGTQPTFLECPALQSMTGQPSRWCCL